MIEKFESGEFFLELEWIDYIDNLKKEITPKTKKEVEFALKNAIEKRIPKGEFGVFLSGGIDSSLICKILKDTGAKFTCYCVGIKGSTDIESAKIVAKHLNLNLKVKEFEIDEVEEFIKKAAKIVPIKDVVSIGVGAVVVAAVQLAKQDNLSIFFTGLGSEEIFAGYDRHLTAHDINDECWRGLRDVFYKRDLVRDTALASALKISARVPFLDDSVIKAAMGVHGNEKIKNGHKKAVLREIADDFKLPKDIVWRKRTAAQYGSGFDKALDKLAKKNKTTKSEFIAHLV